MTTRDPTPPPQMPVGTDAQRIAAVLNEPNAWLIQRVLAWLVSGVTDRSP